MQITSDIELSGAGCTTAITPNQLVQSSSENDNAYTVSRLALEAGVSVHIVRDYLLRGLLRPVACTTGGYGLFDDAALQRLCFVRAAFEAGIGLDALARLCRALDAADCDETAAQLAVLSQFVERRREALADLEVQLAAMPTAPAQQAESLP